MKHFVTLLLAVVTVQTSLCQVGINNTTPDANAALDIKSGNKGLLIPRTSTTGRIAIATTAKGMLVYDTTTSSFWYHTGVAWTELTTTNNVWGINGNGGTTVANFIGTTDAQPVRFRFNNASAGIIDSISFNTALGIAALRNNTVGNNDVAIGYAALSGNSSGVHNTATGSQALQSNSTGTNNTANGFIALNSNTIGTNNTGMGTNALRSNLDGNNNTAVGVSALFANTTGDDNAANGVNALRFNTMGINNTASGSQALYTNATGGNNTATGFQALYSNTGHYNTASGSQALYSNTLGFYNTAAGVDALYFNTNGANNTATGYQALFTNSTGDDNTANGYQALFNNTASENIAIGNGSLYNTTSGFGNVGCGYQALRNNINGNNNIAIGNGADVLGGGLINAIAIGYNANVNATNKIRLGNTATSVIEGQVAYTYPSDGRFKTGVTEAGVPGLNFILGLRPVAYHFDYPAFSKFIGEKTMDEAQLVARSGQMELGFIAQDVEKLTKEKGVIFNAVHVPDNAQDNYSLSYMHFVMPLVKAVQEQQKMIEEQKEQMQLMQKEIDALKKP
ncbi:MAG: tail fiber domain-containing protein [Ferruginibacter sp.]